jgi:hypothetical protein
MTREVQNTEKGLRLMGTLKCPQKSQIIYWVITPKLKVMYLQSLTGYKGVSVHEKTCPHLESLTTSPGADVILQAWNSQWWNSDHIAELCRLSALQSPLIPWYRRRANAACCHRHNDSSSLGLEAYLRSLGLCLCFVFLRPLYWPTEFLPLNILLPVIVTHQWEIGYTILAKAATIWPHTT